MMKTYTEKDFINIIRKDTKPLSFGDFCNTTQIGKLWDKFEPDDIRVQKLKTKENFYKWCYDFIHNDEPLALYFNKRLSFRPMKPVPLQKVRNKSIQNKPNNTRMIRNINLEGILNCLGYDGMSIKKIYKEALETGKMGACFTSPSVFKKTINGDYNSFVVTLKTSSGQMSIYSPSVYKTLLNELNKYISTDKQKMLNPTASWSTPVLATKDSYEYTDVHIVDVQKDALDICQDLHTHIHSQGLFNEEPYSLKTFCVPSEKMSSVVDDDYDKIFFCPPYYDLEIYGGSGEQSTTLYKNYEEWLDGYWRQTVNECDKVLKKGGVFSFTMGCFIRGYEMGQDMLNIAAEKFKLVDEIKILPIAEPTRDSTVQDKYEICYIMVKEQ